MIDTTNIKEYCRRDTEIVLQSVLKLKDKLGENNINVRRLYTISQVAINYLLQSLLRLPNEHIYEDTTRYKFWHPQNPDKIHESYRLGRVEAFKTGIIEGCTYIDVNSLFPLASIKMRFPDLRTEKLIKEPLKNNTIKDTIYQLGISKCLLYNKSNNLGLMPIRTNIGNYYPKSGKYLLGTWTNTELAHAIQEGYEIVDIEYTITWKDSDNPFRTITPKLYELRKQAEDPLSDYLYKSLMNTSYGKLAQRKGFQEIVIDSVEKSEEYIRKNYKKIKGHDLSYVYKREYEGQLKGHYAPIIASELVATARTIMYHHYKSIDHDDIIYTDTDSIIFTGHHINKFDIGPRLGQFKIIGENKKTIIYGRKTYAFDKDIKISGLTKSGINLEDFEKGYIESKKMVTLKTSHNLSEIGSFKKEKRNLKHQQINYLTLKENLDDVKIYIDKDTEVGYWIQILKKISH